MSLKLLTIVEALRLPLVVAAGLGLGLMGSALAQTPPAAAAPAAAAPIPQYGVNVNLEQAHKVVAAGIAEARKMGWPMAVAVVDNAGQLVAFERLDNTQTGSIAASQSKAVSSAWYRRSTKVFQDAVAGGGAGLRVVTLPGASAVEGGLPLYLEGKVIGAVGVSGGSSDQDGVVAKAGAESLSTK